MCDEYIAVIDSGIGGLNVLYNLVLKYPNLKFLYFSDSKNAPYGNKNTSELYNIACQNIEYVKSFGVKALVLGCNTLSSNLLKELSGFSRIPTYGVTPPIDYVLKHYNKVLLLATMGTAKNYNSIDGLDVVGMRDLAADVDKNCFNLDAVDFKAHLISSSCGSYYDKQGWYDAVILGCTHYNFIKNKIFDHLKPLNIFSSEDFMPKLPFDEEYLFKSQVNYKRFRVLFVGDDAKRNERLWCQMWF